MYMGVGADVIEGDGMGAQTTKTMFLNLLYKKVVVSSLVYIVKSHFLNDNDN